MPVNLQQTGGGGGGGTTLTGTGLARQTGVCTELSGDVTTSGSNVTAVKSDLALPGNPTTTTQTQANNSTRVATTAYVDTGLGTKQATLTGTGLARQTGACTELSGDVTTSGSNAASVVKVNGASVPASSGLVGTNGSGQIIDATSGSFVWYVEDFLNSTASITVSAQSANRNFENLINYAPITSGTTGTIASHTTTSGSFINTGTVLLTTPATSGSGVEMKGLQASTGVSPFLTLGSNVPWQSDFWVKLPATITNYCARVGLLPASATADPQTNGMWVEYDTANANSNSVWTLRTVNSSASTYVVTAVTPAASTWYHIRISSTVSGTISAQIGTANGALGSAVTSNTNINASQLAPGVQVLPRTTAAVTLIVDRMSFLAITGRV